MNKKEVATKILGSFTQMITVNLFPIGKTSVDGIGENGHKTDSEYTDKNTRGRTLCSYRGSRTLCWFSNVASFPVSLQSAEA